MRSFEDRRDIGKPVVTHEFQNGGSESEEQRQAMPHDFFGAFGRICRQLLLEAHIPRLGQKLRHAVCE